MNSQKADNVLNLALDATEAEREKSAELDVGTEGELWEVIIKYSGDLDTVREVADEVTELQNEDTERTHGGVGVTCSRGIY